MARGGLGNADKQERTGSNAMIPYAALDALAAALLSAITMVVATAVASVAAAPGESATARKVSTATNPYDTESMLENGHRKGGGLEAPLPHEG